MSTDAEIQTRLIVGFEIHVQLATKTKLFCGCALGFGETPNSALCPVCMGLPGALPVLNRQAYDYSVLTGLALDCEIAEFTKWDRKSYYYPDLPKNYQTSQYDLPLASNGHFEIETKSGTRRIGILRAHLEEDAGKNLHDVPGCSLIDLNRAGTPLLEIVTQPEIHDPEEAYTFCTELQKLVTYLGVTHGIMQKGQMRFEPNINVAITTGGTEYRTPISEVKNLNSFRSVRSAIEYEFHRQVHDWKSDNGYLIKERPNENRGWDDDKGVTVFQRSKEGADDYRYFPDPDLVPVTVTQDWVNEVRLSLPELPAARIKRLTTDLKLTTEDAAAIVANRATADLFEAAIEAGGPATTLMKQYLNVWAKLANDQDASIAGLGVGHEAMASLAAMTEKGVVNATAANKIAEALIGSDKSPETLAEEMGLIAVLDEDQTEKWIDEAFAENADAVKDAVSSPKKAKKAAGFLRGQVMRISGGKANPKITGDLIEARLAELASEG